MATPVPDQSTSITAILNLIGVGRFHYALLGYTALSWAADAAETMILSFLGPSTVCTWPQAVGPFRESLLTSVVFAGMMGGVYLLGAVADVFGRRKGFLVSASLLGGAGILSALAPSFTALLALRFIVGIALGGTPIAITLFAEFSPSTRRGTFTLILQAAWTVGTMLTALLAWAVLPSSGWRVLLFLSALPMLSLLLAYPWLPESPHWLVANGRYSDAEDIIVRVAKMNGTDEKLPPLRLEAAGRARSDQMSVNFSTPSIRLTAWLKHAYSTLFGSAPSRRTTLLLWGIWFVNALTYYGLVLLTTSLLQHTHDSNSNAVLQRQEGISGPDYDSRCSPDGRPRFTSADYSAILITAAAEAPGIAIAALFVDNKGRIWCLRTGLIVCSLSILSLLGASSFAAQLFFLFLARAGIEGTFSVLYVYTPELYPTNVRSFGLALCNGFSRIGGFLAPFVTVYLVESDRTKWAISVLSIMCLCAAGAAILLQVETKARSLEDVVDNAVEAIGREEEVVPLRHYHHGDDTADV